MNKFVSMSCVFRFVTGLLIALMHLMKVKNRAVRIIVSIAKLLSTIIFQSKTRFLYSGPSFLMEKGTVLMEPMSVLHCTIRIPSVGEMK